MLARCILESGKWEKIPLDAGVASSADGAMAGMPGMAPSYSGNATWTFIAGLSAVKLGNLGLANQARTRLSEMRQSMSTKDAYEAKPLAIMENEVAASIQLARGKNSEALSLAQEAADIESTMAPPSGPPEPIKPAFEFYGEVLLQRGKAAEAAAAFQQQLLRTPKRTPAVQGLGKANGRAAANPYFPSKNSRISFTTSAVFS